MTCKQHEWKDIGYYDHGFGTSTSCVAKWCINCGSLKKLDKITKPKYKMQIIRKR